jgi:hypothetical protein
MDASFNITYKLLAFADPQLTSDPRLKHVDWTRNVSGIPVRNPSGPGYTIAPGATVNIFSGVSPTTLDGTTTFSFSLLPVEGASRYRFTWTGGTNPTLRTPRNLTPTGIALTFTVNANATVSVSSASPVFAGVVAGDGVFIPHTTTGDAPNLISVLNAGYWVVLGVTDTQNITLVRPTGQEFEAVGETVTPASNSQFRAYSDAGVQVDDSVDISLGFAPTVQTTFDVASVTDAFFEVVSTEPLPNQTGILPTAAGMVFYNALKQFVYIETSQEIVVRVNGDTGNFQRVQPIDSSDQMKPGPYMRWGPTWSLSLYNRSAATANVTIISFE